MRSNEVDFVTPLTVTKIDTCYEKNCNRTIAIKVNATYNSNTLTTRAYK